MGVEFLSDGQAAAFGRFSGVLRHASARLLGQLRLMRVDHMFELEI